MQEVLVVGGSGYLGVEVVTALRDNKYSPVVLSRSAEEEKEAHYRGKMEDPALLEKVYREHPCDTVVILAADKDATKAAQDPVGCVENNIVHAMALATKAIQLGAKNIVFASSSLVYAPKEEKLKESDPLVTAGAYHKSKALGEETLRTLITKDNGVRICVARFSNLAGATEDSPPHGGVIPTFVKTALTGGEITVAGKNIQNEFQSVKRDFLHVSDAAAIIPKMVSRMRKREGEAFDIVNVGSGAGASLQALVDHLPKHPQQALKINTKADPQVVLSVALDITKAEQEYGWRPSDLSTPKSLVESEAAHQERQQAKAARTKQLTQQRASLMRGLCAFGAFCVVAKVASHLFSSTPQPSLLG